MRKQIVAGNWKMNLVAEEAYALARKIEKYGIDHSENKHPEIILAPPFLYLEAIADNLQLLPNVRIAAQNCHEASAGAYTGEVSAGMIKSIGVDYVILGHSERRAFFEENNSLIKSKVDTVLQNGLPPILCCGENESVRDSGDHKKFIEMQLTESLFHLSAGEIEKCVIAYEPIWAIGTGKTASPEQAQEMHSFIRFLLDHQYGSQTAQAVPILYGGSCKPGNAKEIFGGSDVDGGLIGGASLNADDFIAIIEAL